MLETRVILPLYLIADTVVKISHLNAPKSARVLVLFCSFASLSHSGFLLLFKQFGRCNVLLDLFVTKIEYIFTVPRNQKGGSMHQNTT
jgi:hypothetical protein